VELTFSSYTDSDCSSSLFSSLEISLSSSFLLFPLRGLGPEVVYLAETAFFATKVFLLLLRAAFRKVALDGYLAEEFSDGSSLKSDLSASDLLL
jgi:hypothetical protein